jgi:hypothetical protein
MNEKICLPKTKKNVNSSSVFTGDKINLFDFVLYLQNTNTVAKNVLSFEYHQYFTH